MIVECPGIEVLSMYLDHELDPQMQQDLIAHLNTCPACAETLAGLQQNHTMLNSILTGPQVPRQTGRPCYSPEILSAYADGLLAPQEAPDLETHLHTCDVCMDEVMACRKTLSLLRYGKPIAPPAHLVAAVQQQWTGATRPSLVEKLGTMILQVATEGLTFVEALLCPEHVRLAISGQLLPAGALRSPQETTGATALVDIQQTVRDIDIHMRLLHEAQHTVLLQVQLRSQGKPVARRRVTLVRHETTLASHTTSPNGDVSFPRLTPGEYTVRIPQDNVETSLILRAAAQS
jgi:anti-sigma factor RsiW